MKADPGSVRELFPAPETVDEGEDSLFIVEGEPKAVAARTVGLPAVAFAGTNGWQESHAERFRDRRVCVASDCDEVGRKASAAVAASLAGIAAEVRVLDLDPDRGDGFDIDDFLRAAQTWDDRVAARRLLLDMAARSPLARQAVANDGAVLLDELADFVRRYVVLSPTQGTAATLWTLHTHAFDAAEATPYLSINSAEPESGKTRLLEVLDLVVAEPWLTGRVTPAVLARRIDDKRPTLLLDESDAAFAGDKEYAETLRGILNTGYRIGGCASVCVGQGANIGYKDLKTFSPKAIAGLSHLPDTVASRSIRIELKRKAADENVQRLRRRDATAAAEPLKQRLAVWAQARLDQLAAARPAVPQQLGDRAADVWEPLLAIADAAGGEWPKRAREAAVSLSARGQREAESLGVRLLGDIRAVFNRRELDRMPSADLTAELNGLEDAPWAELRGKPLTPHQLARRLTPYHIRPKGIRVGDETRGATKHRNSPMPGAAISHRPPTQTATSATLAQPRGFPAISKPQQNPTCCSPKGPIFRSTMRMLQLLQFQRG